MKELKIIFFIILTVEILRFFYNLYKSNRKLKGGLIKPEKSLDDTFLALHCFGCKTKVEKPVKIYQGEKLYCQKCVKTLNLLSK